MINILEQIFNGELFVHEQIKPDTPEYNQRFVQMTKEMEFWEGKLSGEEYGRLDKLMDIVAEMNRDEKYEAFRYGTKYALSIIWESMRN